MKPRVLLMSSVHPAKDPRIVYKIAPALVRDYEVICALPGAVAHSSEIRFISLPYFSRLFWRLLICHPILLWHVIRTRPDLVHILVPELIPLAWISGLLGASVVYEVQENLYQKFSIKTLNNAWIFQQFFRLFDQLARRKFHLIFTDEGYLKEYVNVSRPHAVVRNFVSADMQDIRFSQPALRPEFLYLGTISMERGLDVMVAACARLTTVCKDFHLHFFGTMRVGKEELEKLPGFEIARHHMTFHGYTDQRTLGKKICKPVAAIALLKPVADYRESYTTKLFEYMAMGIPVITSDFPLYADVVEHSGCGFCISPYNAEQLFEKLVWLLENPVESLQMGINGKKFSGESYSWESEQKILVQFYKSVFCYEAAK